MTRRAMVIQVHMLLWIGIDGKMRCMPRKIVALLSNCHLSNCQRPTLQLWNPPCCPPLIIQKLKQLKNENCNWTNWRRKIEIEKNWGENWNCHLSNCQRKFEMHLLWSFKSTNWSFKGLSGTINLLSVQFPIFSWLDFQDWKFLWRVYSRVLRKIANQNRKGVRRRDEDAIIGGGPLEGPKGS